MNDNNKSIFCKLLFISFISTSAFSQNIERLIYSDFGLAFTLINPDERTSSMGGNGVSNSENANAIFTNFSLSSFNEHKHGVNISFVPGIMNEGGNLFNLSGSYAVADDHTIGISARYLNLDAINYSDINNNPAGVAEPYAYEISVAYAFQLSQNFSIGLRPKYIFANMAPGHQFQGIDIQSGKSIAADISFSYFKKLNSNRDRFTVGFNMVNIGGRISYLVPINDQEEIFHIPSLAIVGLSYERFLSDKWTTTVSAAYNYKYKDISEITPNWSIGNELTYHDKVSLRFGYEQQNLNDFTFDVILFGLGIKHKAISIDLGYQFSKELINDNQVRLSMGTMF